MRKRNSKNVIKKNNHNSTIIKIYQTLKRKLFPISYGDESAKSMQFDSLRMLCGFALMFAYSTIMLGRLNRVESRE